MRIKREQLQLYLVMGSQNSFDEPAHVLKAAIEGGVTLFQFREKGEHAKKGAERKQLARQLQVICKQHGVPFIVNDDVELAIELDADGVHIGQDDGNPEEVRKKIGDKILGISTHSVEEAKAAVAQGADYIGVGPMYHTVTKADIEEVRGPIVIQEIRAAGISLPLVGIGGITSERITAIIEAGADGVALISAISKSENPKLVAEACAGKMFLR
jgi:thiamine-phosphate pyrophosphorylase